jgi:transposase
MASLQTTAPTISRWKQRFEQDGIGGLDPRHKGSQPRVADAAVQARIARKTQQKPTDGSTHWSCRKMAAALGLSKSTVQRVWAQMRLNPHRLDGHMASNDPRFEEKAADIVGLYMNPPQHAAVFCVGMRRRRSKRSTGSIPCCRYRRGAPNGTALNTIATAPCPLYAALDVKTGQIQGMTAGTAHQQGVHRLPGRLSGTHRMGQGTSRGAR